MNAANRGTRARPTAARLRVPSKSRSCVSAQHGSTSCPLFFRINYLRVAPPRLGGLSVQGGSPFFGAISNLHLDLKQ